jgi:hypothetical protein
MAYYYTIEFTLSGGRWVKFGSGTNGRRAQIERTLATQGATSITGQEFPTGDFERRGLEGQVGRQHKATRYWGFRGEFDGCTEVWPASEGPALLRSAARILAAMKTGAKFDEPTASEAVINLIRSVILAMPNHQQVSLLDLCSGDGALSNLLAGEVARIQQVTIDPPAALPGDAPNWAIDVKPGDVLAIPDGRRADVVVMNPPFSDPDAEKIGGGLNTSQNYFWQFIRKAQALAPVVIFIAPQTWESGLNAETRTGVYEVLEYAANFEGHPTASVVRWTAGPEFRVIGGRDSRKPVVPRFNVEVMKTSNQPGRTGWDAGLKMTGRVIREGEVPTCRDILLTGPDATACAQWLEANFDALMSWWGTSASNARQIKTSAVRELLK